MDNSLLLSAGIIAFVAAVLVAGIRALVPKIDGKAIVGACVLIVGVGLSFLVGGLGWREAIVRGLLAGVGAFSLCSAWQWGTSKLPLSTNNLSQLLAEAAERNEAMLECARQQEQAAREDEKGSPTVPEPAKEPETAEPAAEQSSQEPKA